MTKLVHAASGVNPEQAVEIHDASDGVRKECLVAASAIRDAAEAQGLPDTTVNDMVSAGIVQTAARVTAQRAAK